MPIPSKRYFITKRNIKHTDIINNQLVIITMKIRDQEQNLGRSFVKKNIFAALIFQHDFYRSFKIYASRFSCGLL